MQNTSTDLSFLIILSKCLSSCLWSKLEMHSRTSVEITLTSSTNPIWLSWVARETVNLNIIHSQSLRLSLCFSYYLSPFQFFGSSNVNQIICRSDVSECWSKLLHNLQWSMENLFWSANKKLFLVNFQSLWLENYENSPLELRYKKKWRKKGELVRFIVGERTAAENWGSGLW